MRPGPPTQLARWDRFNGFCKDRQRANKAEMFWKRHKRIPEVHEVENPSRFSKNPAVNSAFAHQQKNQGADFLGRIRAGLFKPVDPLAAASAVSAATLPFLSDAANAIQGGLSLLSTASQ